MNYQNIVGTKLGQAALTTGYQTVYTTPANTRTFLKDIDVCNTTTGSIALSLHLVPSGGTAGTDNALFYGYSVPGNGVTQWTGCQIMNAGDTLQARGAAVGLTLTASGGEAV